MPSLKPWIEAGRPKTLPAALVPVLVGGALAWRTGTFQLLPWSLCLAFAVLVQIGTNYANDYYDFVKGADTARRIGPRRAVASGWVSPAAMRQAMWRVFALAFLVGCGLIPYGGWILLLVGVLSILCGIAYTGGPYPLGYNGWGDLFVFIFFGWVATGFTYYVQAGTFSVSLGGSPGSLWIWLAGAVPGALSTNLLVVNNVRDAPLDREAGKRTLAVRFGRRMARLQYLLLSLLTLVLATLFAVAAGHWAVLLPWLSLPFMAAAVRLLYRAEGREDYQSALVMTAWILVLNGGLFAAGLALSA